MVDDEYFDLVLDANSEKNSDGQDMVVDAASNPDEVAKPVTAVDSSENHSGHNHHHSGPNHHHHHHHHRHHHRRNHRSHHSKKKNKISVFIKKNKKVLVNLSLMLLLAIMFICIILWVENSQKKAEAPIRHISETNGYIRVETSLYPTEVSIANTALAEYMTSEDISVESIYKDYGGSENRLDTALPVRFSYDVTGIPSGVSVECAELEVSENDSYTDAQVLTLNNNSDAVDIYLLKSGTQYYYRLNLTLSDGSLTGSCGSFKTADSLRFMNVDGAYNMRDIGGWTTISGKKIKQGLLYRGTEIDGAVESKYCLTDTGIKQMTSVLNIKTDMDLREKSDTSEGKDILGADVKHTYYGAPMYTAIFEEINAERVRKIFSDLADESNYPVYLHCTYGRDRTGTVCYILEALLGLSDKDLRREYELSNFATSIDLEAFAGLTTMLSLYDGSSTQEKAENYLLSVGVTAEEIASIRNIFLGE